MQRRGVEPVQAPKRRPGAIFDGPGFGAWDAVNDLPFDIMRLHEAYAGGLDPTGVVDEIYCRIHDADDPGIFLHLVDHEATRSEAAALGAFDPAAKPLWGVPFAVKDNIDSFGAPTTAACPAYTYTAERDAHVVAVLRQAGAILIGKTNLDQFATGLVGVRTPWPAPKNALDPTLVPGGSSSGSAVAVARGLVSFALGTDTAGSGRVPAALNNIVGLKPTLGALSNSGVVPACRTLDTVSVFALSVDDAYAVFRAAAVFDPADAFARSMAPPPLAPPPSAFRVGVPDAATRRFAGDAVQATWFDAALEGVAALGGEIVEIDFTPFYEVATLLYDGPWIAERTAAVGPLLRDDAGSLLAVTRSIIEAGQTYSATDAFRGMYRLRDLVRATEAAFRNVDLLCVPTIPTFFRIADVDADPYGPNATLGTYTNFVNLMDLCGIAVPVAPRSDDRPGSLTLLAEAGRDAQVAALAAALHRSADPCLGATGWTLPPCSPLEPAAGTDEIAIAVVGAHMAGLPLNGQLVQLGARFLQETETAPEYRLYRLAGGPPLRPGLIRDSRGAKIALEVWALPAARFGDFMRKIPAPLGIGTLILANGETVKGFLCEPSGLAGAEDITAFGGWRAYLDTPSSSRHAIEELSNAST